MPFQTADVEKEYEKDKNLKREDVKSLMEWVEKQPHLPKATELQVLLMLQCCYYHKEAAKTAIDNYFTIKTLCPDIFTPLTEDAIKQALSVAHVNVLPEKTPEGHTVILSGLVDTNPENYIYVNQVKLADMTVTLNCYENGTSEGLRFVIDMKGSSFVHLTKVNLVVMKKHAYYVQEGAPLRLKGIHYINPAPFMDKLLAMVKPFLKKELINMMHIHTDLNSLFKYIPKEILPTDIGGEYPTTVRELNQRSEKNLIDNLELFSWLFTQKVDESKRPGKPKDAGEMFGLEGSFKKLEVD